MRVWISRSAGRKLFIDYLKDTYPKKLINVCDMRNVYNAMVINFTMANDPRDNKFKSEVGPLKRIARDIVKAIPAHITVVYDWFDEDTVNEIDYFILHNENDTDKIMRMEDEAARGAEVQRVHDNWMMIKSGHINKVILLGYDERARDVFEIHKDADEGVVLSIPETFVKDHRHRDLSETIAKEQAARILTL